MTRAVSSDSRGTVGHDPEDLSMTSSHQTPLGPIGTSIPSRQKTTTCVIVGQSLTARSASGFNGICLPRRETPSAVKSTLTPESERRVASAAAPNAEKRSEEHTSELQ